jgi:RNA polymerase sigma-70 factor, ECF subfamily
LGCRGGDLGRHMDDARRDDAAIDELVRRAAEGDAAAFAELYDVYAPRVRRFLRHQLGDADVAEELLQRTFVKMIEALPRYRPRGLPLGAWVFRIARNAVIDHRRTTHPSLPLETAAERPTEAGDPVAAAERHDDRDRLRAALDALPPDQREVLVWRFFADLSPAETAVLMGRSNGAVRILQHRALASLRGSLATVERDAEGAPG